MFEHKYVIYNGRIYFVEHFIYVNVVGEAEPYGWFNMWPVDDRYDLFSDFILLSEVEIY